MSGEIHLTLYDNEREPQTVVVHSNEKVRVLENYMNSKENRYLMHKGLLLMTSFTFKYHGINDGDSICVLKTANKNQKHESIKPIGKKEYNFGIFANQPIYREISKIIDLVCVKIENSPKLYRKRLKKADYAITQIPEMRSGPPTIIFEAPTAPSKGKLPTFWNQA